MAEEHVTAKFLAGPLFVDPLLAASTATYSIANRSNNGQDGRGYPTVAEALTAAGIGETMYLRGGTYAELATFQTGRQCCFWINKSVTLQAYGNEIPILTYPAGSPPIVDGTDYGPIVYATVNNWTIDGATIIGTRDMGDSPGGQDTDVSIQFGTTISNAAIRRCTFQKAGHCSIKFISTNGPVTIERNRFLSNGFTQRDHHIYISDANTNVTIRLNEFTGATGYAVHLYDRNPTNVNIYGNIMHHNGGNYSPVGGGGILLGGTGHTVINNTIVDNTGYGGIVFWKTAAGGNVVKNNIIRNGANVSADIYLDQASGPNTVGTNNKHTIGTNTDLSAYSSATDLDTSPGFTSGSPATWTDYTLQAGSPMRTSGETQSAPYNAALDPAQTTTPTGKTQASPPTIGGFTT